MSKITVYPRTKLNGVISVDGDKSITHRAIMHAGLANGTSIIRHFLNGNDCQATIDCMRSMGVSIIEVGDELIITGNGINGLVQPADDLNCVRSGTTIRLLMGLLCGMKGKQFVLNADEQLLKRPMERVAVPLREMGAQIETTAGKPPVKIYGASLVGKEITLEVPSAQVTSALIYAGLFADGETIIKQDAPIRDHTERMLNGQGANISRIGNEIHVQPVNSLSAFEMNIPGDISSAAFPIVAAVINKKAEIRIESIGINDSRMGLIDVLKEMGAKISIENEELDAIEPIGDLLVKSSSLKCIEIGGDTIVRAIDEIPLVALLATQAEGKTVIRDAQELRVKETDRIESICTELNKLGAKVTATPDGMIIDGPTLLKGAVVDSHGDHRIAMALFIAGCIAEGKTDIEQFECVTDSFPGFLDVMSAIGASYE
jgi:3-phosphoshikimate 1-carboxyvinyltransferase